MVAGLDELAGVYSDTAAGHDATPRHPPWILDNHHRPHSDFSYSQPSGSARPSKRQRAVASTSTPPTVRKANAKAAKAQRRHSGSAAHPIWLAPTSSLEEALLEPLSTSKKHARTPARPSEAAPSVVEVESRVGRAGLQVSRRARQAESELSNRQLAPSLSGNSLSADLQFSVYLENERNVVLSLMKTKRESETWRSNISRGVVDAGVFGTAVGL